MSAVETPSTAASRAENFLRQGEPLLAHDVVSEALAKSQDDVRLRQLQGLALARSGATERANAILQELNWPKVTAPCPRITSGEVPIKPLRPLNSDEHWIDGDERADELDDCRNVFNFKAAAVPADLRVLQFANP